MQLKINKIQPELGRMQPTLHSKIGLRGEENEF